MRAYEALIEMLFAIIAMQGETIEELTSKVEELEARLNQNSTNSSKPPSSDGLSKPATKSLRQKSGKKPGGQKGHKGSGLKIDREPDEVVVVQPTTCPECGESLHDTPTSHADTRYVYDIQIRIILRKYDIEKAQCPCCSTTVVGETPAECKGSVNYGNGIRTLAVILTNYANVSIDKTHKILSDLIGLPISTGTINNIEREFAGKTDDAIAFIKENLLKSDVLHIDETGIRIDGKTRWMHVVSNNEHTLLNPHEKRGREGSEDSGILVHYDKTLMHDCWKPNFSYDQCDHALCCAHLLRELNEQIEQDQLWAQEMKDLLLNMKNVTDRYMQKDKTELSWYYRNQFKKRYDAVLASGRAEITPSETRKKTKAENLLNRFEEYREEITRFASDFKVPFDNNLAERDLRNTKVKQKVSGCFRTFEGAKNFSKITSVMGTAIKLGKSVFKTVRKIFDGESGVLGASE